MAAVHTLVVDLRLRLLGLEPAAIDFALCPFPPPTKCMFLCLLQAQVGADMQDARDDYNIWI